MIGQRLGHYHIVAKLGEGGMGEVFRATDTKLGRDVALKVLPADMARDPERLARFQREARAVAALNHPHIVTIYSVEEAGGIHFLTMELVEGQSLAQLIPENGLSVDRIVSTAAALAEALMSAHEKGIVHRDLKPANVMMTADGRIKVLDFGLAKEMRAADPGDVTLTAVGRTQAGMVMGTPAYMSPEQLAGRPVDHRTDIFSLGILVYEMATGRRPFEGSTSIELASAILRDIPQPLSAIRSDVPADLSGLIGRCLEKDPRQRAQTAREVCNGLREIARSASQANVGAAVTTPKDVSNAVSADEGFRIAVLPFKYRGADASLDALADGLSEEIVTGLSRFSYLRVISRSSTSRYAGTADDVRTVGQAIGARYVIEGSVRQAGSQLRVAAQLVDAATGAHLWAETYNRPFRSDAIFDLQDDLVPRIVSTVADSSGVLPHSMSELVRARASEDLTPYEAVLRAKGFWERSTPGEHAEVRDCLERVLEKAPDHADILACLSFIYQDEYRHRFNPRPDPLKRARAAAQRAVEVAPSNDYAHHVLASAHFFLGDLPSFRRAAERAIAINPMDATNVAFMGILIAYAGDWDRGCALVERSLPLNPHHPGWFWFGPFYNAYRQGDYRSALDIAVKINMPGYFGAQQTLVAVYGQLGERDAARAAVAHLQTLWPDYGKVARAEIGKWMFAQPDLLEQVLDGLRKAGLDVPAEKHTPDRTPAEEPAVRPEATVPSIAVLPFANLSADKEQEYFSDGLAEEIINLLAHVPGLKVIARTSAFAFRGKDEDVRKIAQALNVTHVLEGSVRRAGGRIRVTAQLIAAGDGSHIWSERYDRELSDIFAVQDEISAAISGALRVTLSGGSLAQRYQPKLPAYEAYLKAKHHLGNVTPESMELARRCYESAIELDPQFGLAHVGVGFYWLAMAIFGQCPAGEAVPAARAAVQRALQTDKSLPEAHAVLGYAAAMYDRDWTAAERHFDFPLARQAGFPLIRPVYGAFQFLRGKVGEAIDLAQRAIEEDPLEVWPRMNLHAYLQAAGRDRDAYDETLKVLELDANLVVARVSVAHFHADWGELPEALQAARKAYAVGPWYPDAIATLAALLRRSGDEEESRALYRQLGVGERAGDARAQAVYWLLGGDVDKAADWVERALDERDHSILYYLRFVVSKPLRASVRWPKVARMMNLADEMTAGRDNGSGMN